MTQPPPNEPRPTLFIFLLALREVLPLWRIIRSILGKGESMAGNASVKALLILLDEVALELIKVLKDGFQPGQDLAELVGFALSNEDFKKRISDVATSISQVPSEIGDLDIGEIVDLVMTEVQYVPKFIDALKKQA